MTGGIGDFNRMVGLFVGMVRVVTFSYSFPSSSFSISSVVECSLLVVVSWFRKQSPE